MNPKFPVLSFSRRYTNQRPGQELAFFYGAIPSDLNPLTLDPAFTGTAVYATALRALWTP